MIRSGSFPGVAFGTAADGDGRVDAEQRIAVADEVGASRDWATVSQVHGPNVVVAEAGGHLGEADGLITETAGVSLVVATADCLPVAIAGRHSIALVHAGWRGIVSGVIPSAMEAMRAMGDEPSEAAIGPHIGPCCYEVGTEVIRCARRPCIDDQLGHAERGSGVGSSWTARWPSRLGVAIVHDG